MEDPRRLIIRLAVAVSDPRDWLSGGEMRALERLNDAGFGPLSGLAVEEMGRAAHQPTDVRATCAALRSLHAQPCAPAHAIGILVQLFEAVPRGPSVNAASQATATDELARARALLGIQADAERTTVDAAYRALVARYDPSSMMPFGSGFVALAVRRLSDVTTAYITVLESGVEPGLAEDLPQ
jgi:hypothetical protein